MYEEFDLLRQYPSYHISRPDTVEIVTIPELVYLMIDGHGMPADPEFGPEGQALYHVVNTLKQHYASTGHADYHTGPLEAQWWPADGRPMEVSRAEQWRWTAMIMLPGEATPEIFNRAVLEAWSEQTGPALGRVRLEAVTEGTVAQALYVGPPAEKTPLVIQAQAFATDQGYQLHGKYHEIYLANPTQVPLELCRTIVRQPIRKQQ